MALGIRGSNPIWAEFNLAGLIFDDTYWMYVVENTIPYAPKNVYTDPDLNVIWNNPIQFLGNGTLPNNIYFLPGVVYRLEFRKSDGLSAPSQQDPLIYLVENYMAGEGGSTPIDTVALTSSNQVTNPQFALFSLENPTTISDTNPDPIVIAPGWRLEVAGTGSVTISQVALNSDTPTDSNAPYALRLQLSGWTADSVNLIQRFEQSGVLWSNKIVSTAITARVEDAIVTISANLFDSQNTPITSDLITTPVGNLFEEFTSYDDVIVSTDTDDPPDAYIEYRLALPSNVDIFITSIQLVVQDLSVEPSFEQDSINRQIDHSYNTAYPIVPVGTIIDFAGFTTPQHYYLCDGSEIDRVRDYQLFNTLTIVETVTLTNGLNTFVVASSANYYIDMEIEGDGIPASTTIIGISGNTITMSANATDTGPSDVRFFGWGAGDGSTTFNVPDLSGYATAGAYDALFAAGRNGVGYKGGVAAQPIAVDNIPLDFPEATIPFNIEGGTQPPPIHQVAYGSSSPAMYGVFPVDTDVVFTEVGGGVDLPIVQPTALVRKCIRYE